MIKNKILPVIALLLSFQFISFAQVNLSKDFKVSVSDPFAVIDGASKEYFSDGKGFAIAVKTNGEKAFIQRFNVSTMKEVNRNEYEDFPPYNKVQKIMQVGDRLYYIFSSFDKKAKVENIYSREINMADASFQKAKLLFSTSSEVTVSSYVDNIPGTFGAGGIRFEVLTSFDNSKIMIRYRTKPQVKKDSKNFDVLGFYVFDAGFTKVWGGEAKMPYTEKEMNNLAYSVTKDGKAFMLAYLNETKAFELFAINKDLSVKKSKMDIDGKLFFQEFKLRESADGNISCTGYYANGLDVKVNWTGNAALSFNTNGILHFKMDQEGKILEKYDYEFPIALINQFESTRAQDKNEKREGEGKAGINDVKMTNLIQNADGSTIIVGEQQYIRNEFVGTKQQIVYHYGHVIMTKIDKNGKLLWMNKLPKNQAGVVGKGGMGIRFIKSADAEYVLFLDNIKNANLSKDEAPAKHMDGRGGYLTAFKVNDGTGAFEKHYLFDIEDINGQQAYQFKTPRIFDSSDKTFLLEVYLKGKKDGIVKMELLK